MLAGRLRKHAKLDPHVQVVHFRTAIHVVPLWLIPVSAVELAAIEQTDDGKSEAHSPAMRPFSEFSAGTRYAEAFAAGICELNYSKPICKSCSARSAVSRRARRRAGVEGRSNTTTT